MSGEAVADAGVSPIVTTAAAQRLRWIADLGLKKHFNGVVPPTYEVVMEAIENMGSRT